MMELREEFARKSFEIWADRDEWEDLEWEDIGDKHQVAHYKEADELLSLVRQKVKECQMTPEELSEAAQNSKHWILAFNTPMGNEVLMEIMSLVAAAYQLKLLKQLGEK